MSALPTWAKDSLIGLFVIVLIVAVLACAVMLDGPTARRFWRGVENELRRAKKRTWCFVFHWRRFPVVGRRDFAFSISQVWWRCGTPGCGEDWWTTR